MSHCRLVTLLIAGLLATGWLAAQETRSMIFGRVLDPQAMPVAGASVTVTNTNTGTSALFKSNETGYYEANLLLPGSYQVAAEAPGFKKSVRSGITLPVSTRAQIDMKLEIGALTESVSVTAEAPLLETNALSSGRIVDRRSLGALPVSNKNTMLIYRLTPGIQTTGINEVASVYNTSNAQYGNLPGNVGGSEWSIDGVPVVGPSRQAAEQPFTDVVEEFKVETSAFDASIGHTLGISVSFKTKSGANDFHGSLSELHWQQRWRASGFFVKQTYYRNIAAAAASGNLQQAAALRSQPIQPPGHSNNYAATLGGPVIVPKVFNGRNKLFFFFSFNGIDDLKSTNTDLINRTIPTAANLGGDFSQLLAVGSQYQIYDPLTIRPDPARPTHYVRDPIPGNILPTSRVLNPGYSVYTKFLPTPNNNPLDPKLEPTNNYRAVAIPTNAFYKAYTNRTDYQHSEKNRMFVRWSYQTDFEPGKDWTYASAPGLHDQRLLRMYRNAILDWVHVLNASTVLDFSLAASEVRRSFDLSVPYQYKPSDVGLPAYLDAKAGSQHVLPMMSMSGYETIGQNPRPVDHFRTVTSKAQLSHVRGRHTLTAGLDFRQAFQTYAGGGNTSGNFAFSNAFTQRTDDGFTPAGSLGLSWAAFMMGLPGTMTVDTNDSFAIYSPYYGWFGQDNWRVTSKLSLTLGLRMEYEMGPTERYNRLIGYFNSGATLPITAAAQAAYARSPVPELKAQDFVVQGGSVYLGSNGAPRTLWRGQLMWLPRLAAAYQLDSKTVLRAGYGLFYDTLNVLGIFGYTYPDQSGFSRSTSTTVTTNFGATWLVGDPAHGISPLRDPFPVRADGTRFDAPVRDALGLMARAGQGWSFGDYNRSHPRQQRWRAGIQRQLGNDMVVDVAYTAYYAAGVPISQNLSPLPQQYWGTGLTRNDAITTNLNSNVANPFQISNFADLRTPSPVIYQTMSNLGFFTGATIQKQKLLRVYSQMNGLTETVSSGKSRSDGIEISFQRRFARCFNLYAGYTRLWLKQADYFYNQYDLEPSWEPSNNGRPHRLVGTSVIELPFGKGHRLASGGLMDWLFGGFQIGVTYEYQPGPLLDWANLFYYGNLSDINTGTRTLDHWFNTDNFERTPAKTPTAYNLRVFPTRIDGLRADKTSEWDANVTRSFRIREGLRLQLRVDCMNLQNRSQFAAPVTNPTSTDFGKVTSQTAALNRFIQIQGRITF